jgi:adenylate cyclase
MWLRHAPRLFQPARRLHGAESRAAFDLEHLATPTPGHGVARSLKNIERPIRVFVTGGTDRSTRTSDTRVTDKPSIAVLPFLNMSGDPEQQYFSDGITEDILTELSRFRALSVIARNSSFRFRGEDVDVVRVGRELKVQYVLEGSVRKIGNKIRITAQLIDAASGSHVWADRFDRTPDEIFAVPDTEYQAVRR